MMNNRSRRLLFIAACLNGFCAVVAGAFAAHVLTRQLDEYRLELFRTAAFYQMVHALAMLVGLQLDAQSGRNDAAWSALFFLVGILLFSGSLYLLALHRIRFIGMITPVGGVAFLLGWLALANAGRKRDSP